MTQVELIYRRMAHHSPHSGYDRLAAYLPEASSPDLDLPRPLRRPLLTLYHRLLRTDGVRHYSGEQFLDEVSLLPRRLRGGTLQHYLYGDSQLWLGGRLRAGRNRLLATFHNPPAVAERCLRSKGHLSGLDGAIVVGQSQVDWFAALLGPDRVHHVPHGVDAEFFQPGGETEPGLVLSVGHYLRDRDTLRAVDAELRAREPGYRLVVVSDRADGLEGLDVRRGISEDALRDLYRRACLTLLPLRDGTANNALLESLACGTPLVLSDVGDARAYAGEGALYAAPGDVDGHVEATLRLLGDAELRAQRGAAARKAAEALAWPRIVERLRVVYRTLAAS